MTPQVISLSAAGSTAWIPVDYKQNPFNISLAIVLSNTPSLTCKVEYTLDDVFNTAITPTAFTVSGLSAVTSNSTGSITTPVKAIRLTVSAWTSGTVTLTALQGMVDSTGWRSQEELLSIHKAEHTSIGLPYLVTGVPAILSSLVAGTVASRTANTVLVDCGAAHNIPATTYDGFWVHYAGSPNLSSGWYPSFTRTGANTFTFVASGTDFGSESVNGGAANTFATTVTQVTIPANTVGSNGKITASLITGGDNTVTKTFILTLNGSNCAAHVGSTFNIGERRISIVPYGNGALSVRDAVNNTGDNSLTTIATWNRAAASTVAIRMAAGASAGWVVLFAGSQIEVKS